MLSGLKLLLVLGSHHSADVRGDEARRSTVFRNTNLVANPCEGYCIGVRSTLIARLHVQKGTAKVNGGDGGPGSSFSPAPKRESCGASGLAPSATEEPATNSAGNIGERWQRQPARTGADARHRSGCAELNIAVRPDSSSSGSNHSYLFARREHDCPSPPVSHAGWSRLRRSLRPQTEAGDGGSPDCERWVRTVCMSIRLQKCFKVLLAKISICQALA